MNREGNHQEFIRISKLIYKTDDPEEVRRIKVRLQELNREYFGVEAILGQPIIVNEVKGGEIPR